MKVVTISVGLSVCFAGSLQASTLVQEPTVLDAVQEDELSYSNTPKQVHRVLGLGAGGESSLSDIRVMFLTLPSVDERFTPYELDQKMLGVIEQANDIFINSRVDAKVSMAYVGPWTLGSEAWFQNATAQQMFNSMRLTVSDAYWGEGRLAEQYQADVIFLVDYRDSKDAYCGWASIGSESGIKSKAQTSSFGVIRLGPGCGESAYILTHELGHLLGAAHGANEPLRASSSFGYGTECGQAHTVMHQSFPKTRYFSSSQLQQEGVSCGSFELEDNARLFVSRTKLLADKHVNRNTGAYLIDKFRYHVEPETGLVKVTLFRAGNLDLESRLRWDYSYLYSSQGSDIQGGEATFLKGQSSVEIDADLAWGVINRKGTFGVYFKNASELDLNMAELKLDLDREALDNGPLANFSVSVDGAMIRFINKTDSEFELVSFHWDLGDGQEVFGENDFNHSYQAEGEYSVTLTVVDELGAEDSLTIPVIVGDNQAGSEVSSSGESDASGSEGGGSMGLYCLCLLMASVGVRAIRDIKCDDEEPAGKS